MKLPGTADVDLDDRLESLLVPIDEIYPDSMNPRRVKDIDRLVRRFQRFGYTDPVVVNRETKLIEAGHMRVTAALQLGATHVPAVFVDHDIIQGRAEALGTRQSYVARVEGGDASPSIVSIFAWAAALGIEPGRLLGSTPIA